MNKSFVQSILTHGQKYRGITCDVGIVDEGFFLPDRLLIPLMPAISTVRNNVTIMLCSPPDPALESNMFIEQYERGTDADGAPLCASVAYTICRSCEIVEQARGAASRGTCAHLLAARFPWVAPLEDLRTENTVGSVLRTERAVGRVPAAVIENMFHPPAPQPPALEPMIMVAIDPGAGASLTAAAAGVLTTSGVSLVGLFRSDDDRTQADAVVTFIDALMRRYPMYDVLVYVERNLKGPATEIISKLLESANERAGDGRGNLVVMREPTAISAGIGFFTTQKSKNWAGQMLFRWLMHNWFSVAAGCLTQAITRGGATDQRAFLATEICEHVQNVHFGRQDITFKDGGNDDWACALAFLLHGFVCASPSTRLHYTRLVPDGVRTLRLNATIGLGEMLALYRV